MTIVAPFQTAWRAYVSADATTEPSRRGGASPAGEDALRSQATACAPMARDPGQRLDWQSCQCHMMCKGRRKVAVAWRGGARRSVLSPRRGLTKKACPLPRAAPVASLQSPPSGARNGSSWCAIRGSRWTTTATTPGLSRRGGTSPAGGTPALPGNGNGDNQAVSKSGTGTHRR